VFEAWAFLPPRSGDFPNPQLGLLGLIDHYWTSPPQVQLRLQNQSALQRIAIHGVQLLHPAVCGDADQSGRSPETLKDSISKNNKARLVGPAFLFGTGLADLVLAVKPSMLISSKSCS